MRKISLLLVLTLVFMVMPLGQFHALAVTCPDSFTSEFDTGATTGSIAREFSTFRYAPAGADVVRVLSPATFDVLGQTCVNGLSWVQLEYTSGTTVDGRAASSLGVGWALESQDYFDGLYGPGRWLTSGAGPTPGTCQYSYATAFDTATAGQIAHVFSTLRSAPGAVTGTRVLAPATFDVLDQGCFGGFSWVQITYTSGVTSTGKSAVGMSGWALESQIYFDGTFGPGTWLEPVQTS